MFRKKWKPSKTKIKEFVEKMDEIDQFCAENKINQSKNSDSYYFSIDGVNYRVSNHSIESSNAGAVDDFGIKRREKYHPDEREDDVVYIHASKTRIIEIYNNLKKGVKLDGRGYRKFN